MAAVRSPTLSASTELTSSTIASPTSPRRRQPEPFPSFDSDGTASTAPSARPIPRTTLLASRNDKHLLDSASSPAAAQRPKALQHQTSLPTRSESDRTDALWAEMQATLADVELSASRGTRFFGATHSAALDDLRNAQIDLAKAWARGESGHLPDETGRRRGNTSGSDANSDQSPGTSLKSPDDDAGPSPDRDVEAARKRREANDQYFYRIQQGVLDVVDKLEGVAEAMGKVERESREIWAGSESDDLDSSS